MSPNAKTGYVASSLIDEGTTKPNELLIMIYNE